MGRPLKKWPTYALGVLESSVDRLKEMQAEAAAAEESIVAGNTVVAMKQLSDLRAKAISVAVELLLAQEGKYSQEQPAQWNPPAAVDKQTISAVKQAVATRRQ